MCISFSIGHFFRIISPLYVQNAETILTIALTESAKVPLISDFLYLPVRYFSNFRDMHFAGLLMFNRIPPMGAR